MPPPDDLRRYDLNLLVAFDILIAERSVTAAAKRMGVGQPAMSNALARLREMFNDRLLIRTQSGMQPTPRALELIEPVARLLDGLREDVFGARSFSPASDTRSFRIGISDQAEAALMQDILRRVRHEAPGMRIIARSVGMHAGAELLAAGAIDLAIGYFPEVEAELEVTTLYHETLVCLFDAQACGLGTPISLDGYVSLPHILVSLRGEPFGHVDELLRQAGRSRFVAYTTPHFLAVPFLLHGFRAIAAVPRRLAENCAEAAGLSICPVPLPSDGYDVRMAWHQRTTSDPAHTWLRSIVASIGQARNRAV
jgi:DNA-binding transcriptional LysR family regulator